MKKLTLLVLFLSITFIGNSQLNYKTIEMNGIKKLKTINLSEIEDPFQSNLQVIEAPSVSGTSYKDYLKEVKKDMKEMYPSNNASPIQKRAVVDPPRIIKSWKGNNSTVGTPLDTHMAISNDGQVISTINSHIAIFDTDGNLEKSLTLSAFSLGLDIASNRFDPRVYYDVEEDKFILVFLAGSSRNSTDIVVGFSETSDATGNWNLYTLPGNPDMSNVWTDYPMITITPSSFLLTVNYVIDGVSWQDGFSETVIWKMDKMEGYVGGDINSVLLRDVNYDGQNVRNLCPVKSADGVFSETNYFLSSRNFAIETDTIFLGKLNEDNTLEMQVLLSPTKYGVPPNAQQVTGELQTNDARVLDGFILNDEIHFVGNTRNLTNNLAGIFHGIITNVSSTPEVDLNHIIGPDFEIGYPGISYAGTPNSEEGAMINFTHTSDEQFPGLSAMWYDFNQGYSDIITIKEGTTVIDMIGNFVDRWGDYAGTQRKYNDPEVVWVNGTYGSGNNNWNIPWVASLATPGGVLPTNEIGDEIQNKVFPNPLQDQFSVEFDVPNATERLKIDLFNAQGKLVDVLYNDTPRKSGMSKFSFLTNSLESGNYILTVNINGLIVSTQKLIIQK